MFVVDLVKSLLCRLIKFQFYHIDGILCFHRNVSSSPESMLFHQYTEIRKQGKDDIHCLLIMPLINTFHLYESYDRCTPSYLHRESPPLESQRRSACLLDITSLPYYQLFTIFTLAKISINPETAKRFRDLFILYSTVYSIP